VSGHVLRTVGEQGDAQPISPTVEIRAEAASTRVNGALPTRSDSAGQVDLQVKLRRVGDLLCEVGQILRDIQLDATPEPRLMESVKTVRFLSAKDIAHRLQVDEKTIRRWHHSGRIPKGITIGSVLRWPVETIDSWLEEMR
jgi:predicted DNA-binding transcriptional regulator AlpA